MTYRSWARDLLDFLLPAGCLVCGLWVPRGRTLLCGRCKSLLRSAPWPRCARCHAPTGTGRAPADDCLECRSWPPELAAARYAHPLEAPASDLVHALKYGGWREAADVMAASMASVAPPEVGVLVPVPTTGRRRRERGYNQAELLADGLAARLGATAVAALRRRGEGASQTELAPDERRRNVRGVFEPTPGCRAVRGRRVLLVDDVLTTGATASEAAGVLRRVGAVDVTLVTFARALPGRLRRAA